MSATDKEIYHLKRTLDKTWPEVHKEFHWRSLASLQSCLSRYESTLPKKVSERDLLRIPRPQTKKINSKAFLMWLRLQKEFEELSNRYMEETLL